MFADGRVLNFSEQLAALVEDHARVEDCPTVIEVGFAEIEEVGVPGLTTVPTLTVALAEATCPLLLVQVTV